MAILVPRWSRAGPWPKCRRISEDSFFVKTCGTFTKRNEKNEEKNIMIKNVSVGPIFA